MTDERPQVDYAELERDIERGRLEHRKGRPFGKSFMCTGCPNFWPCVAARLAEHADRLAHEDMAHEMMESFEQGYEEGVGHEHH